MEYIVPIGVQSGVQSGVHSKILWTNMVHMVHKVQNVDQFWSTKFQQGMNYYDPHGIAHRRMKPNRRDPTEIIVRRFPPTDPLHDQTT